MFFKENDIVLFQGDSVTDCGRNRSDYYDLGVGYPLIISSLLYHKHCDKNITFLNRAVSGDVSKQMLARWEDDFVALKPTVVSILIGINDTWRRYDGTNVTTSAEQFEANYRACLDKAKELGCRIVMLEPFSLPIIQERVDWRIDLDPKIAVVRKLAKEYGAVLVPTDGLMNAGFVAAPNPEYYSKDGVHPTYAGHGLIAEAWLKAVGIE